MGNKRELGEPSKKDLSEMKDLAEFLTMDSHSVMVIANTLLEAWNLGHNQGYADANIERESK